MIHYIAEEVELPQMQQQQISRWIKLVVIEYQKKVGNINYVFCSDERILKVNNQFLNHDYFTDIITFDYSEGSVISGDIFISIDTVKSNSLEFKSSFDQELYRIIIHGVLHLCGQDDQTPALRKQMTDKENAALGKLSDFGL